MKTYTVNKDSLRTVKTKITNGGEKLNVNTVDLFLKAEE